MISSISCKNLSDTAVRTKEEVSRSLREILVKIGLKYMIALYTCKD